MVTVMILSVGATATAGAASGVPAASSTVDRVQAPGGAGTLAGSTTAGAVEFQRSTDGSKDSPQEWVLVHVETGELRVFDGDRPLEALPVDLSNFRVVQRGVATSKETDDASTVAQATDGSVGTSSYTAGRQIRATLENPRRAIGSSDVVRVRVGAYNGTTLVPVANYSLTVDLTNRTSGVIASQTVTTNASGGAVVTFDMAPYADGRYTIEATDGTTTDFARFVAGEFTTLIPRFGGDATNTGREVTYGVRVTNGGTPVSGATRNVTITNDTRALIAEKTVTTNADGVATFSFTPSDLGRFSVSIEQPAVGSLSESLTVGAATAQVGLPQERYESYRPGQTVPITGFARVNGTPLSSTGLELRVLNDSFGVVDTISVTTDARGAFSADWTVPGDTTESDYTIDVRTGDGRPVAAGSPTIDVDRSGGGPAPGPAPSLDVRITTSGFEYVPGTKLNVSATVTDSDGDPVSGATVNILNTLGFSGTPVGNATVTTDSAGVARATFVLPDNPDYGVENGQFRATTVVNGTRIVGSDFYDLQHVEIDRRFTGLDDDFSFVPGSTVTLDYTLREATNNDTLGDPVRGVPIHAAGIYRDYEAGIFGTAYAATNATGQASLSVSIPGDAAGELRIEAFSTVPNIYGLGTGVDGYNTRLNGIDRFEYARNDTIEFNYTVNTTSTVRAFVTVTTSSDTNDSVLFSGYLSPDETGSFTIPKTVPNETFYEITVRAMSNAGVSGAANEFIEIRGGPTANETADDCINRGVAGTDGAISLGEIQNAIDWWATGAEVPDTGGETISLSKIQDLIDAWATGRTVSCS